MWTHHAQVLPVFIFADDVPHAGEGGARVLVDGDLLIWGGRFTLTWNTCNLLTFKERQQMFKTRFRAETSRLNKSHCLVILWLETYSMWLQNKYATLWHPQTSKCPLCPLTSTFLQDDDHTFAISGRLDANSLAVNETIEAESIPGLQVIWLLEERKDIWDQKAGII